MLKRIVIAVIALVVLLAGGGYGWLCWYGAASQDPTFFESDIQAFEEEDRIRPLAPGTVLFTGSSSIRLWSTLEQDMAPLAVRNRGFGGSQMSHVVHFAERIVGGGGPAAVVVYAGDNDLDVRTGKTAEVVRDDFQELVRVVNRLHPETRIYYLTIKPSRLRWDRWPEMERANQMIQAFAESDPRLAVIDIGPAILGPDGTPRDDVFLFDGLHLNATGYEGWTAIVRPVLLRDLGRGSSLPSTDR